VNTGLDVDGIADLTACDDGLDREEVNVPSAILMYGKEYAVFLCTLNHIVKVLDCECYGFFAYGVLFLRQCRYNNVLMYVVGGSAKNDVDLGVGYKLFERGVNANAALDRRLDSLFVYVVYSGKLNNVACERLLRVPRALSAVANDTKFLFPNGISRLIVFFFILTHKALCVNIFS
jgi:hypothetical protein